MFHRPIYHCLLHNQVEYRHHHHNHHHHLHHRQGFHPDQNLTKSGCQKYLPTLLQHRHHTFHFHLSLRKVQMVYHRRFLMHLYRVPNHHHHPFHLHPNHHCRPHSHLYQIQYSLRSHTYNYQTQICV